MQNRVPEKPETPHCIEIFVERLEQLFNSMDPSPFQDKDLDDDAEEFIVNSAREYPSRAPLRLRIHLKQDPVSADAREIIQSAIHNYFSYRRNLNRLEFKRLMKEGRASLVIGGLFLTVCLFIADLLKQFQLGPFLSITRESLTIAGWVAMWQPMQIFLYEWWPLRRVGQTYEQLSRMPVELQKTDATRR